MAKIHHAHLFGERQTKYQWLAENDIKTTAWTILKPQSPFYLFVPQNTDLLPEYNQGWKITDMMPVNSTGMVSKRDSLAFQFERETVKKIIEDIFNLSEDEIVKKYPLSSWSSRDGKVEYVKKSVLEYGVDASRFVQALYRPFDKRWTYYTPESKGFIAWTVNDVMQHMMLGDNLGLIFMRQVALQDDYSHFIATDIIVDNRCFYSNKGIMSLAPIYIYPTEKNNLFNPEHTTRHANFSPAFIDYLEQHLNLKFIIEEPGDFTTTISAVDVFNYIYAVLHSPTYRQRYAEFLKMDFPRVPITHDKNLFQQLAVVGENLIAIHLMQADIENDSGFNIAGDNLVEKVEYKDGKVYINKTQYFDNVASEVWEFHIGGYQVCQKWLKDRKGMILDYAACKNYLYILAAVEKTRALMAQIDEIIPSFPFDREQNHA